MKSIAILGILALEAVTLFAVSAEQLTGWSFVITACTGGITAIGVILIAYLNRKVSQVEKQGNSVSLELKRTNAVFARATAVATKKKADAIIADEADKAYEAAMAANAKL